ncbi:helix-turn-helix domain-containing protein [Cupriavidus campinensis]|uniref:helix-turn-helix domain-containing protein n=1 Tax=Cupriavidus campinensis TaxID=151783 RepID=UPI0011ED9AB8
MFNRTQNTVRLAVDRIGGPTKASHATGVSNATIFNWINRQRVPDIDKARLLAKLANIEVNELRGTR